VTLPILGTISYSTPAGTFTFGPFCKSRVSINPLPDRAGRTTKAVEYTIHVDDIITPEQDIVDITTEMRRVKKILTARCGHLIYQGRGFGLPEDELDVNDPSGKGIRDVMYGPVPKIGEFYPLGGLDAQAAKLSWSVTTVIPECSNAKYQDQPMDFSYEVGFSVDENGYTTRSINGALEIPATRINGSRVPPDVADKYWELIWESLPMLPGFRRNHNHKSNLDKRVLTFSITDRELTPTAFQEGFDNWTGEHSIGSQLRDGGFAKWQNQLSATFTVSRNVDWSVGKKAAYDRFKLLTASRLPPPNKHTPLSYNIRNSLNSQDISFSVSWVKLNSALAIAAADNKVFVPVPAADWEKWRKAASGAEGRPGAAAARGAAGLLYKLEWDAIIDLCSPQPPRQSPPEVNDQPKKKGPILEIKIPPEPNGGNVGQPRFGNVKNAGDLAVRKPPKAEESFLHYECHLTFVGSGGVARHKPLHYATTAQASVDPLDSNIKTRFQQGSAPSDTLQTIGPATCEVVLHGQAVRAGYAVVPPKLIEIGGVAAVQVDERIDNFDFGNTGGLSVFGGRWAVTYLLDRVPGGAIQVPKNLLSPEDGSGVERV